MPEDTELLRSIDTKLAALLAITLDQYLRETDLARPRHASVDSMLRSVGMGARDIAALLGKTEQAVYNKWKVDDEASANKKSSRKKKTGVTDD